MFQDFYSHPVSAYQEQFLLDMPEPHPTDLVEISSGETLLQSFRPVSDYPVQNTFRLDYLIVRLYRYPGATFDIDINIYEGNLTTSPLIYTQKLTDWYSDFQFIDEETGLIVPEGQSFIWNKLIAF